MARLDLNDVTTTDLDKSLDTYAVDSAALDYASSQNTETTWDFPNSNKYLGYYKSIPELKKAIDALAIWTAGKGYETESIKSGLELDNIQGWGEDTFQSIMENMIIIKKIIGDSFAEIIRNDKGTLINIKPISPERMRLVVNSDGIIVRYELKNTDPVVTFKPEEILHLCNDRIADEIHGTSVIEACEWVINARHEAMTDYRKVLHRNVIPVRILEFDTQDTNKRDLLIREYEQAIKKGEVLVIPKGTVEVKDNTITIQDPTNWIRYLENFFYQAVGIPRVIATSEDYTEAASKVGYMTFEPIYTREQSLLEQDLWAQIAIKLTFNRPPSLSGVVQEDEEKNTGQTGIQPNEVTATAGRVE